MRIELTLMLRRRIVRLDMTCGRGVIGWLGEDDWADSRQGVTGYTPPFSHFSKILMSAVCQGSFTTTRLLAMTKTMVVELLERQQNRPKTIKELQMQ